MTLHVESMSCAPVRADPGVKMHGRATQAHGFSLSPIK